jgi:pimeloyl-ACP methyl ester carboxylesterase
MSSIERFELSVPEAELEALRARLAQTRWPEPETVGDWSQGAPLTATRALVDYWRHGYDWRRCEAMLNGWGQSKTTIDGLGVHFLHIRSPEPEAMPLIMTHGWPGSVIEFNKVIGPLTDPVAHGGQARDAFHLVVPSLPGYGFSDKPTEAGWNVERTASAWIQLMARLGYGRWAAQGGDWGAAVTAAIGQAAPPGLLGIHLNVAFLPVPFDQPDPTPEEQAAFADIQHYDRWQSGYAKEQSTRPQTIGYSLVDSPVGQAAWIYEKFHDWTDHSGSPETILSMDEMLDNIMLYWLPGAGASSARMYWESLMRLPYGRVEVPTGLSIFPREMFRASRRWAEQSYANLIHFGVLKRGGHFAAFEQPAIFTDEVRKTFAPLR